MFVSLSSQRAAHKRNNKSALSACDVFYGCYFPSFIADPLAVSLHSDYLFSAQYNWMVSTLERMYGLSVAVGALLCWRELLDNVSIECYLKQKNSQST